MSGAVRFPAAQPPSVSHRYDRTVGRGTSRASRSPRRRMTGRTALSPPTRSRRRSPCASPCLPGGGHMGGAIAHCPVPPPRPPGPPRGRASLRLATLRDFPNIFRLIKYRTPARRARPDRGREPLRHYILHQRTYSLKKTFQRCIHLVAEPNTPSEATKPESSVTSLFDARWSATGRDLLVSC